MRFALLLFIYHIFFLSVNAQATIEITYQRSEVPGGLSIFDMQHQKLKKSSFFWHSVHRGDTTFTFANHNKKGKKRHLINGLYGEELIHHGWYYIHGDRNNYELVNLRGEKYLIYIKDSSNRKFYWLDTTRNILGYDCQAAWAVNLWGDTSTFWIAKNVKPDLLTNHFGVVVPGLVMESLNLKYAMYYRAISVEKTHNKIYFPHQLPAYSLEEYRKRRALERREE